jgi:hypothetical protein
LTEPDVVPMTPEQHDQAVTALATMIVDWLCAPHPAAAVEKSEVSDRRKPQPTGHEM